MTALSRLLTQRITRTGPMTLADFMAEALLHPEHGYYTTRDPLGAAGDFITAPEISQMFGELLGLCLAQTWQDQGTPDHFVLAELGPGRGTLMADVLRAAGKVPGFRDAAKLHLVEASPPLRKQQADLLGEGVEWHQSVETLPQAPLYLLANEFFDALPIRQFQRDPKGWRERQIGVIDAALAFGLSEPLPIADLDHRLEDTVAGDIVERCALAQAIMGRIGGRIEQHGGAALIMDYGDWRSQGDTFQALKSHTPVNPLEQPGKADLTAHVDFEALAHAAAPASYSRLTPQGVFLERLGITSRAQHLAKSLTGPALDQHIAAHRRLTHPAEMGTLFKVLGVYPSGQSPPPGLEP